MSRLMPAPSDARAFTSYLSAGQREEALQRQAKAMNENQYRQYLQQNADSIARDLARVTVTPIAPAPRR